MATLQDQLLKAGLIDQSKARKVRKEKRDLNKAARKTKQFDPDTVPHPAQQDYARRVEHDRKLNRQQQDKADLKAITAQIIQLIQMNKVDRTDGDTGYSFVEQNIVKKIYLTKAQKTQLSLGRLAIVRSGNNSQSSYEVVPAVVADKIAQRDKTRVVQMDKQVEPDIGDNDPYADYKVPDDLMW